MTATPFSRLAVLPPDPILGLTEAFRAEPREDKINLSVGVYQDGDGRTPRLRCVGVAEERLVGKPQSGYLPITGDAEFLACVRGLLFGGQAASHADRLTMLQAPGGTGALRIAGDFLRRTIRGGSIWISSPSWPNHRGVFEASGHVVAEYPYWDAAAKQLDFVGMLQAMDDATAGDVFVLHGCCHNPTGVDPTLEQWREIAAKLASRGLLPLIDFAYQGFAEGLTEDLAPLHAILDACPEAIVCSSYSKNFGLYNQRVGALAILSADADAARAVTSHVKSVVRANYSNPPAHGARIVSTILQDAELRAGWEVELTEMRNRILDMRAALAAGLAKRTPGRDWSHLAAQRGMFSYTGLTAAEVDRLREEHAVYLVRSGRINVAGVNDANVERLCDAVAAVVQQPERVA